jgi:hypothetical protein
MRFFNEFVRKIPIRKMQCYVTIMVFDIKGGISEFKLNFFLSNFNAFLGAKICSYMWVIDGPLFCFCYFISERGLNSEIVQI